MTNDNNNEENDNDNDDDGGNDEMKAMIEMIMKILMMINVKNDNNGNE